jgi:hypothetical protein
MAQRPDPDLTALACARSLAQIWNAKPSALQQAVAQAVHPDPDMLGWMQARLSLQGLSRPAGKFPREIPFPLAPMQDGLPGAIGFVRCAFSARATEAPPAMDAVTQRILEWFGDRTRQTVTAHFDLPPDSDGGSAALAVVVASLLAREPELAPGLGTTDPEAHRFAATGTLATDTGQLRLVATQQGFEAKARTLREYGYRTLFVVAPAAGSPRRERPDGLQLVELPADLAACVATLRRWFLAQLPASARLRYRLRRHRMGLAVAASLVLATAALLAVVGVRNHVLAGERAAAQLAAAAAAAEQFDWSREGELLDSAYGMRPDLVDATAHAAARERAARLSSSPPPPFAGIESAFCVVADVVVGHSHTEWLGWDLTSGEVRWRRPRAPSPVADVRQLGNHVLATHADGSLRVLAPADGAVLDERDLGFAVATVACRGPLVLAAGEDRLVLWDRATDSIETLPTVPLRAGYDHVTFLPTPQRGAVVRKNGTATVFAWGVTPSPPHREQTCPTPAKPESRDTTLLVQDGTAYVLREDARKVMAWDLAANRIRATYLSPEGHEFSTIAQGAAGTTMVAALLDTASNSTVLAEWPSANANDPPRLRAVPEKLGGAATLVRIGPRALVAHAHLGLTLTGTQLPTHNGAQPAFGTLVPVDLDRGVTPSPAPSLRLTCLAALPDGAQFVCGGDDGVLRWGTIAPPRWTRQVAIADAGLVGCWWTATGFLLLDAEGRLLQLPLDGDAAPTELARLGIRPHYAAFDAASKVLVAAPRAILLATPAVPTQPWLRRHQPAQDHFRSDELMHGRAVVVDLRRTPVKKHELTNLPYDLRCVAVSPTGKLGFGGMRAIEIRGVDAPADSVGDRLHIATPSRSIAFGPVGEACAVGDIAGAVHVFVGGSWSSEPLLLLPTETGCEATHLAFSADGLQLAAHLRSQELGASAAGRGMVQWWWTGTGTPIFHAACAPLGALARAPAQDEYGWLAAGWDRRVLSLR